MKFYYAAPREAMEKIVGEGRIRKSWDGEVYLCKKPEDSCKFLVIRGMRKVCVIDVATHLSCPKINQIDCHRMSRYNGISLKKGKVPGHLQFRHR